MQLKKREKKREVFSRDMSRVSKVFRKTSGRVEQGSKGL